MTYLLDSINSGIRSGIALRRQYDAGTAQQEERAQKGRLKTLAEAMAADPTQSAIPTAATPGIAPQPQGGIPAGGTVEQPGGVPAAPSALAEGQPAQTYGYEAAPDADDSPPVMPAVKKEAQQISASAEQMTAAKWDAYSRKILDAAAATGDPKAVAAARDRVKEVKHTGFMDNLKMAQVYMGSGQMDAAKMYLEKAHQFMPNGLAGKWAVAPDKSAIVLRPEREDGVADKSLPPVIAFNRSAAPGQMTTLQKMISNFKDPATFAMHEQQASLAAEQRTHDRGREAIKDTQTAESHESTLASQGQARAASRQSVASTRQAMQIAIDKTKAGSPERRKAEAEAAKAERASKDDSPEVRKAESLAKKAAAEAKTAEAKNSPQATKLREKQAKADIELAKARTRSALATAAKAGDPKAMNIKQATDAAEKVGFALEDAKELLRVTSKGDPGYDEAKAAVDSLQDTTIALRARMNELSKGGAIPTPDSSGTQPAAAAPGKIPTVTSIEETKGMAPGTKFRFYHPTKKKYMTGEVPNG